MSKLLKKNADYLSLLLRTHSHKQAIALLVTATTDQIQAISEIALNLVNLPLSGEAEAQVNKRRRFLERIGNNHSSLKARARLLKRNHRILLEILHPVTGQILRLLGK